jgi:hypothetical protein
MRHFTVLLTLLVIAGCSHHKQKALIANEAGITISKDLWEISGKSVYPAASQHCQKFGKNAVLKLRQGQEYIFECK